MTETTTKSAARLLTEAAGIARFPAADGWPPELLPGELAALMAGCRRTDDRKRYDVEYRLIATGIKGGKLQTVTVLRPPSLADTFMAVRRAREPGNSGWATNWDSDAPRRIEQIPREVELREVQAIDRASCRTWLDAIEEPAGEYVRAWLGDTCPEPAKAAASKPERATERRDRLAVAIGAALNALRGKLKTEPTAGDVFDYLADHDETGIIEDSNDSFLWWKTSYGGSGKTSRKALANRLTGIKRKSPA
jgi:hypothetical protein